MNGFDGDKVPGWLLEAFDERTTLPHGPLEQFPVPIEGEIIGGKALVPKGGSPARYVVNLNCGEPVDEVMRFLREYLPLSGYVIFGDGTLPARRNFFGKPKSKHFELMLIRRPPFVGTVLVTTREDENGTLVEADVAHPNHPNVKNVIDLANLRGSSSVHWRMLDE